MSDLEDLISIIEASTFTYEDNEEARTRIEQICEDLMNIDEYSLFPTLITSTIHKEANQNNNNRTPLQRTLESRWSPINMEQQDNGHMLQTSMPKNLLQTNNSEYRGSTVIPVSGPHEYQQYVGEKRNVYMPFQTIPVQPRLFQYTEFRAIYAISSICKSDPYNYNQYTEPQYYNIQ